MFRNPDGSLDVRTVALIVIAFLSAPLIGGVLIKIVGLPVNLVSGIAVFLAVIALYPFREKPEYPTTYRYHLNFIGRALLAGFVVFATLTIFDIVVPN